MSRRRNIGGEATRPARGGGFTLTGATDADGIPVELSAYDIQRMDRPAIDAYQEKRQEHIEGRAKKDREANDLERYKEAFVAAGGDPSDAQAAWLAKQKAEATEAANRADAAAEQASRRRVRQAL